MLLCAAISSDVAMHIHIWTTTHVFGPVSIHAHTCRLARLQQATPWITPRRTAVVGSALVYLSDTYTGLKPASQFKPYADTTLFSKEATRSTRPQWSPTANGQRLIYHKTNVETKKSGLSHTGGGPHCIVGSGSGWREVFFP